MIGKLIVHAKNRERAIIRMQRCLEETIIEGQRQLSLTIGQLWVTSHLFLVILIQVF